MVPPCYLLINSPFCCNCNPSWDQHWAWQLTTQWEKVFSLGVVSAMNWHFSSVHMLVNNWLRNRRRRRRVKEEEKTRGRPILVHRNSSLLSAFYFSSSSIFEFFWRESSKELTHRTLCSTQAGKRERQQYLETGPLRKWYIRGALLSTVNRKRNVSNKSAQIL